MYGTTHSFQQSIPSDRTTSRRFRLVQHSHQKCFTRIYTTCSPSIHACDYRPISNPSSRNHQLWNICCGLLFGIFWIKFTIHFRVPYNRRIPFSNGYLAAYKIKTFPFHLMTPAYVDIGFWLFRGLGLDASVLTENYGAQGSLIKRDSLYALFMALTLICWAWWSSFSSRIWYIHTCMHAYIHVVVPLLTKSKPSLSPP